MAELVVLALIDEILAVNLTKLVIVAEYLDLEGDEALVAIVVPLDDQAVNSAVRLAALRLRTAGRLCVQEVIVAIRQYTWYAHIFVHAHLVIVPIQCQALNGVSLGNIESCVVVIEHQVDILRWHVLLALGWSWLLLLLLAEVLSSGGALTLLRVAHHGHGCCLRRCQVRLVHRTL